MSIDSFGAKDSLEVNGTTYAYYRLDKVPGHERLPFSLKVLLENLLRTEDGANITHDDIAFLGKWVADSQPNHEIQFTPSRVIMQDFTGVPCVV
ncbi:MAG: aconitate hydratase, partial [Propionibacterium sp.]|nr:aconitate hydratase [Propionibacterium sp.]